MKKKILTALLLVCTFTALTGCGNNGTTETESTKNTQSQTQTQTQTQTNRPTESQTQSQTQTQTQTQTQSETSTNRNGVVGDVIDDVETGASEIGNDIRNGLR